MRSMPVVRHCEDTDWRYNPNAIRYGYTPAHVAPHLWGGFAQYVYLLTA